MRPTGKLHLGNYVGALKNWVKLQDSHDCFFFVADWHALTTGYDETAQIAANTLEVVIDYLAAGLDPQRCTIFVQSHVLEHAELHVLFSMITPLGWLERVPSFKEQQQQMPNKDLHMYGFLGYPLLQAADILVYRANYVPVGEDQVSHVELTREVARRFNNFYSVRGKPVFPEPEALLTPTPKLLGTDKRKMSKSYGNTILLSDDAITVEKKIHDSVTDRPKLTDKGNPDDCPVGNLHQIFSDSERLKYITRGCITAGITCVECKKLAMKSTNAHLEPFRQRRQRLAENPEQLREVIQSGAKKAARAAEETMVRAREAVGLLGIGEVEKVAAEEAVGSSALRAPESVVKTTNEDEQWQLRASVWLDKVSKSHPLKKDRQRTFITRRGRKVGVHTASEQGGVWTFRLEDRPVNVLALIAQDKDRYLHDYVLPPKVVQDHWKHFSRDSNHVEIMVKQSGDGAALVVNGRETPIRQYEGNYAALE